MKTNKILKTLFIFTMFFTFFLLGLKFSPYVDNYYVNNILKTNNSTLLSKNNNFLNLNNNDLDLERFWDVYSLIKTKYYGIDGINKKELVDGAISGLVASLGDKHSEFFSSKDTIQFNQILSGDFEGIGAVVKKTSLGIEVERIIKGSPAKKYGILEKDIILKANNIELKDLSLYDAVDKIKGPAGTKVTLKVIRQGSNDLLDITLIRAKIKIPSVSSKIFKKDNIGYIELNMFGENTSTDFANELQKMKDTSGLIIDLRNNGGGYLQSAVDILSKFIENGKIVVKTKYRDDFLDFVYRSVNSGKIYSKKIVIIINASSASASEITAGALSDYKKAIIVGEKSYGKGSVQEPFDLKDGSMVKLTIAKWFTPNGKNIDKEGIMPDIEVKFKKEDFEDNYDRQLEESKKILKDFIKLGSLKIVIDKYNKK